MISIVIPTYNRSKLIWKSIMSILKQTYKNFEIIVVDDNSNDNTESIIRSIKDNRIIYLKHEKNMGANAARNTGINNARGEYIAFQDSDDEWLENKLEIQFNELINSKADIVACSFYKYFDNKVKLVPKKNIKDNQIKQKLFFGNFISTQTLLGKKKCFLEEQFDETFPRFQDWELMIRVSQKYKIHFINKPLVNVYVQEDSISKDNSKAIISLKIILEKYKLLLKNDKKALSYMYAQIGSWNRIIKNFDYNYYKEAVKYNPAKIKYVLRMIEFEIKKILLSK